VAEWFCAPADQATGEASSQIQCNKEHASRSVADGRSEPLKTNSDIKRYATNASMSCASASAQAPMQKKAGSSSKGSAVGNATTRFRFRPVRIPEPGSGFAHPFVVKEGMVNMSVYFYIRADQV